MKITYKFTSQEHQFITKYIDGEDQGISVPLSMLNRADFSDFKEAYENNQVMPWKTREELESEATKALIDAGKEERDDYINSPILVNGLLWDIDAKSRDNMHNAIAYVERNYGITDQSHWILADNSVHKSNSVELRQVLDAYAKRMDETFLAYALWRANPVEPFVISEPETSQ